MTHATINDNDVWFPFVLSIGFIIVFLLLDGLVRCISDTIRYTKVCNEYMDNEMPDTNSSSSTPNSATTDDIMSTSNVTINTPENATINNAMTTM
jgi:hypothetical protein